VTGQIEAIAEPAVEHGGRGAYLLPGVLERGWQSLVGDAHLAQRLVHGASDERGPLRPGLVPLKGAGSGAVEQNLRRRSQDGLNRLVLGCTKAARLSYSAGLLNHSLCASTTDGATSSMSGWPGRVTISR